MDRTTHGQPTVHRVEYLHAPKVSSLFPYIHRAAGIILTFTTFHPYFHHDQPLFRRTSRTRGDISSHFRWVIKLRSTFPGNYRLHSIALSLRYSEKRELKGNIVMIARSLIARFAFRNNVVLNKTVGCQARKTNLLDHGWSRLIPDPDQASLSYHVNIPALCKGTWGIQPLLCLSIGGLEA